MELTGRELLLVLRAPAPDIQTVQILPSLNAALAGWSGRDRVAPVFEIATSHSDTDFCFRQNAKASLLFMGPLNPAKADACLPLLTGKYDRAWLSFGLFNLIIYTSTRGRASALTSWANKLQVRWERWDLVGAAVKDVFDSDTRGSTPTDLLRSLSTFRFKSRFPELRDAAEEYCALFAAAVCRSGDLDQLTVQELKQASSMIMQSARQNISKREQKGELSAVTLLVDTNAALSRFTSQMFSGVPPIRETECHFWTHSLLGTGVANLAVTKIRRFITMRLGEARIPDQVKLLEKITDKTLINEVLNDGKLWSGPFLQRLPEMVGRKPLLKSLPPIAPLIPYLSGRDGFHTTQVSLSAPLNILTSCSSLRWSLLTITHEMSHRVIDEVLGYILPDPTLPAELSEATELVNETKEPANLLSALQFKMLLAMAELNETNRLVSFPNEVKPKDIEALMATRREEVEEIMVHVFDFLYFYGADPEVYVPAIWRSWDAIPSLHRRLPSYVLRTACATYAKFWTSSRATQDAIAAVKAGLQDVAKQQGSRFIKEAIEYLTKNADALKTEIAHRQTLVGIVRTFLQSPEIVQSVRGQAEKASSSREGFFDGMPIENPLRFIESYTAARASRSKSMWMLTRLAFDTTEPSPLRIEGIHK